MIETYCPCCPQIIAMVSRVCLKTIVSASTVSEQKWNTSILKRQKQFQYLNDDNYNYIENNCNVSETCNERTDYTRHMIQLHNFNRLFIKAWFYLNRKLILLGRHSFCFVCVESYK